MTNAIALPDLGSDLERAFDTQLRRLGPDLPAPEAGYRVMVKRRWKFDRAWPREKIAVELEGGRYGRTVQCHECGATVRATRADGSAGEPIRILGWHARDDRFQADIEKYNHAQALGWIVLRFSRQDVESRPINMIATLRLIFALRTSVLSEELRRRYEEQCEALV